MKNKITDHHKIPKSLWGTRHFDNIEKKKELKHRAHHTIYENQAPHEQIIEIVDVTGKAFNAVFADDLMSVVNDYDLEDIYNHKCVNMKKLVNYILNKR